MIPYAISIKYMLAGFIAIFLIIAIYLVSLFVRWRRLKRDFQNLEEVENLNK
jgi:regulatory protein YycI of two-component signal transduction system YycFG